MELIIKNGNFYRGDTLVPIVIGDPEQIALLKRMTKEKDEVVECDFSFKDVDVDVICGFRCHCGKPLYYEKTFYSVGVGMADAYDYVDDFDDKEVVCRRCNRHYKINDGKAKML